MKFFLNNNKNRKGKVKKLTKIIRINKASKIK